VWSGGLVPCILAIFIAKHKLRGAMYRAILSRLIGKMPMNLSMLGVAEHAEWAAGRSSL
jgi:hypothetical protein